MDKISLYDGINKADKMDYKILNLIADNPDCGTIILSKKVGISPKSLINRLKKHIKNEWIVVSNIPAKPKGRIRVYKLTTSGLDLLNCLTLFLKDVKEGKK